MANGTIAFDTLTTSDSVNTGAEKSIDTSYLLNGVAKAWINLNGTGTIATNDSFNISGTTDNGTGNYTISFSNSFSSANYSCVVSQEHGGAGGQTSAAYFQTLATGSFVSHHEGVSSGSNTTHNARDFINCSQVTGDLA